MFIINPETEKRMYVTCVISVSKNCRVLRKTYSAEEILNLGKSMKYDQEMKGFSNSY